MTIEGGAARHSERRARSFVPIGLCLTLLIAVAYGRSLGNGFVHDDSLFMTDERAQSLAALPRLVVEPRWGFGDAARRESVHMYYRPLEPLPYAIAHLAGGAAWASHATNLVFHFANALLVFAIARRLTGSDRQGGVAAGLFAVYPAYSEAVLWPAALGGLGAMACSLAILLLDMGDKPARQRWLATGALYLAALWFKETGIMAPLYVAARDVSFGPGGRSRWRYAAFLPPLLLYASLRQLALHGALPRLDHMPFSNTELALNALAIARSFAIVLATPWANNFHRDFDAVTAAADPRVWQGALLLLAALALIVAARRSRPAFAFGVMAMLIAAAPYLIPHKPHDNVFADRYLYDVGFGAAVCAVAAGAAIWQRLDIAGRGIAGTALAAVLLLCVVADVRRAADWRDDLTLFRKTLTQSKRAEIIRVNLAVRLQALGEYDEGIRLLEELVAFAPDYRGAWYNLGLLYQSKGRGGDAIAAYRRAHRRDPDDTSALLNLGYLLDRRGDRDAALAAYFRIIGLRPAHAGAWYNLAVIALEDGQRANARSALRRVLAVQPGDGQATALLTASAGATTAERDSRATLRRCESARAALDAGRRAEALAQLRAAAWRDERAPLPHQYLANLFYLDGDLDAALEHQRRAAELAPENEVYRNNLDALEKATRDRSEQDRAAPDLAGP